MNLPEQWLLYKSDQSLPVLLLKAFQHGYFKEISNKEKPESYNLYWKSCGFSQSEYNNTKPWQLLNHFPKVWISKPSDLSRGRGIYLFSDISDLLYEGPTVVQKYIDNPLLIGGYKFDLRIYVVVTSYHPLRIYMHHDGLVRFGTEKYNQSGIENVYAHLTNTSINRYGPSYSIDKEKIGAGCKWTITQLRSYFAKCNIDDRLIWERIKHLITLTILMQVNAVPRSAKQCIELYGFDVILDSHHKPWLLEVNFTPALGNDCQADVTVKLPMLIDFLKLIRRKIVVPRPATESMRKRRSRVNILRSSAKTTPSRICFNDAKPTGEDFDDDEDFFKRRFMISPLQLENTQKLSKIPDIKISSLKVRLDESSRESLVTSNSNTVNSVRKLRSKSSVTVMSRRRLSTLPASPPEFKIGGFYLTYPISNTTPDVSNGDVDIAKCVAEIRKVLKDSRGKFKLDSMKQSCFYGTPTVNWNLLSGLTVE